MRLVMQKLMSLLFSYVNKKVACIYTISNVIHTVSRLQESLQRDIDLATVPLMEDTNKRLSEHKDNSDTSTWSWQHAKIFTDDDLLGAKEIVATSEEKLVSSKHIETKYPECH